MLLTLPFPNIDPEIFAIDLFGFHLALRWYALAYIAGLVIGWRIVVRMMRRTDIWGGEAPTTAEKTEDLLTWLVLGVVFGGRIGHVLFYNPEILQHPADILKVWEGGMSFHGGFLGVVVAVFIFTKINKISFWSLADALVVVAPIGLFLGRIANFIKPELWGRPTNVPWAVYFPDPVAMTCPDTWLTLCTRHPSQLYEAALEGIVLGLVLFLLAYRRGLLKFPARATAIFFFGYGISRVLVEGFRQADAQFVTPDNPFGHVVLGMTQGQLLSLPMVVIGLILFGWTLRKT